MANFEEALCTAAVFGRKTRRPEPPPLRGTLRLLDALRHAALTEVPLKNGRRADILSIDGAGGIWIVEVKSSVADFRADNKWPDYLDCCDRFFFAVGPAFPVAILPATAGLIVADTYGAVIVKEPEIRRMSARTRQGSILSFGRLAASRIRFAEDPFARGVSAG